MYLQGKEVRNMGIPKGTKLTDNPKNYTMKFRYDDETAKKLNYVAQRDNLTKAEVVRKGIDIQYDSKKE